jgi:hypothetical protein
VTENSPPGKLPPIPKAENVGGDAKPPVSDLIASLLAGSIERGLTPGQEADATAWLKQNGRISFADLQTRRDEGRRLGRFPTYEATREACQKIRQILKYNRKLEREAKGRDAGGSWTRSTLESHARPHRPPQVERSRDGTAPGTSTSRPR